MKVAFILPMITNCGPVNVVLNLCKEYEAVGVKTKIIYLRESCDNNYLEVFLSLNSLGVYKYENENIEYILEEIDVLHSHGYYPDKISRKLKTKAKKISTIHCMFFKDYIKEYGVVKGFLGSISHFMTLKYGGFHKIVGCSKSVSDYILSWIPTLINVRFINNGVDQNIFYPLKIEDKINRINEMSLHKFNKIFIYSGRVIRRKRVPELISIFNQHYSGDNALIILGDGEELEICKKLSNKNVLFMGAVSNPSYYYQIADYVISNSSAEGYPMSIIEAVSCGCKGLLSDIPPHSEFINSNPDLADYIYNADKFKIKNIYEVDSLSSKQMALKYLKIYES